MKYKTIVADPPWQLEMGKKRTGKPWIKRNSIGSNIIPPLAYPTMTIQQMKALPVKDLAEDNAHLYLWTINKYIEQSYALARAWGFRPVQLLTWCKAPMGLGLGGAFAQTTEHVLFCRRGTLKTLTRFDSTWYRWKRGKHSQKPEHFLDMVMTVSPPPYLELFARRVRLGWAAWGNEISSDLRVNGGRAVVALQQREGARE